MKLLLCQVPVTFLLLELLVLELFQLFHVSFPGASDAIGRYLRTQSVLAQAVKGVHTRAYYRYMLCHARRR